MGKVFMSVDPGVGGTGVAVWELDKIGDEVAPIHTEVIKPGRVHAHSTTERWMKKTQAVYGMFSLFLQEWNDVGAVYIEQPQFFGSAGGVAASADVVKLSMLIGTLIGAATAKGASPVLVPVNVWKGQLPKDVTQRRVIRYLKKCTPAGNYYVTLTQGCAPDHLYDAIGIGCYVKGLDI